MARIACVFSLLLCLSAASAARAGQPPYTDAGGDVATPFDEAAADAALEPGSSRVSGRIYAKTGLFRRKYGGRAVVLLMPLTAYHEEWYWRYRTQPRKGQEALAPRAQHVVARAFTDDAGRFTIGNLKPGRYLLYATFSFTERMWVSNRIGTTVFYNEYGAPYTSITRYGNGRYEDTQFNKDILERVEIARDGNQVDLGGLH
jgi:hypothetical protein